MRTHSPFPDSSVTPSDSLKRHREDVDNGWSLQKEGRCQVRSCDTRSFPNRQIFTAAFPPRPLYLSFSYSKKKYLTSHISPKSDNQQENLPPRSQKEIREISYLDSSLAMEKEIKNPIRFVGGKMNTEDKENRKVSLGAEVYTEKNT